MREPRDELFGDGEAAPELKGLLARALEPGESMLWTGRPGPVSLLRRSLPKALLGLGFVAFTLFWMAAVVGGGKNNWDRGKVVAPFARHNVLIAAGAGLWMLPPGFFMLSWPLRAWLRARGTVYALTDRRAIVLGPRLLGEHRVESYPPEALTLMCCTERKDGSGDLVFEDRKTWVGIAQAVGFLAVERVREVETLARKLLSQEASGHGQAPILASRPPVEALTYRISVSSWLQQIIALSVSVVVTACLIGNIVIFLAVLVIMPRRALVGFARIAHDNGWPFPLGITGCLVVGVGLLILVGWCARLVFRFLLAQPTKITVTDDGRIEFRSWLRTVALRADEIISITSGGWADPQRSQVVIRHKGGKMILTHQFPDLRDFLVAVKTLNPTIEVSGF